METIGSNKIWSWLGGAEKPSPTTNGMVRKDAGCPVCSYLDFAKKVAELQYLNRDFVLLFRGQGKDFKNDKLRTSLKPSLFRGEGGGKQSRDIIEERYRRLERAEQLLASLYSRQRLQGRGRVDKYRVLRWAILQHYEVCPTPLLDVTTSLRIAASFATHSAGSKAFIFVLGVPHLSGAVSASAEAGLQMIRLSSTCPPSALRPHIQEGYLLGEYPEMINYQQKRLYAPFEIDFGRRLVAKFVIEPKKFWKNKLFPLVEHSALYPVESSDELQILMDEIKTEIGPMQEHYVP